MGPMSPPSAPHALTVAGLCAVIEEMAPPGLAEPWDNVGLLLGDPQARPCWVAVALDADHALGGCGPAGGAPAALLPDGPGLLVVHHPVPFRPLSRLVAGDPVAGLVLELVRRRVALYAAHTSFDSAPEGLSHVLAENLGLSPAGLRPLRAASGEGFVKLVVFVPEDHSARVRAALAEAGAGWIGNYSDTAFAAPGRGYFRAREGASPTVGSAGVLEEVKEERVETILPRHRLRAVISAMLGAHPYEEPAYDVYPLACHPPVTRPALMTGLGRVGELAEPVAFDLFRAEVERRLGLPAGEARVVCGPRSGDRGSPGPPVRRVAVCPGAGGDYIEEAARAGAEVYVTGDVTYHQAVLAKRLGLAVIDPGHLATEKAFVPVVADRIGRRLAAQGIPLRVIEVPAPSDGTL